MALPVLRLWGSMKDGMAVSPPPASVSLTQLKTGSKDRAADSCIELGLCAGYLCLLP